MRANRRRPIVGDRNAFRLSELGNLVAGNRAAADDRNLVFLQRLGLRISGRLSIRCRLISRIRLRLKRDELLADGQLEDVSGIVSPVVQALFEVAGREFRRGVSLRKPKLRQQRQGGDDEQIPDQMAGGSFIAASLVWLVSGRFLLASRRVAVVLRRHVRTLCSTGCWVNSLKPPSGRPGVKRASAGKNAACSEFDGNLEFTIASVFPGPRPTEPSSTCKESPS